MGNLDKNGQFWGANRIRPHYKLGFLDKRRTNYMHEKDKKDRILGSDYKVEKVQKTSNHTANYSGN